MSAVSAVLTGQQEGVIESFMNKLPNYPSLAVAYLATNKARLDDYFSGYIDDLSRTLDPYLGNLPDTVRNGESPVPEPGDSDDFKYALNWLATVVELIRYSNLSILNYLKRNLIATYEKTTDPRTLFEGTLLIWINDVYVRSVSDEFGTNPIRREQRWLGPNIVNLAALVSMNNAMLPLASHDPFYKLHSAQVHRLVHHRDLIIRLCNEMARYMQIQTRLQYHEIFQDIRVELNHLPYDPDGVELHNISTRLGYAILSMLAIYGRPAESAAPGGSAAPAAPGTEVIPHLLVLEDRWPVRRLINLELDECPDRLWMLGLLKILNKEIETFKNDFGPGSEWTVHIRPLLRKAIGFLSTGQVLEVPG
jgi:hypothetical protein